jgi:DNA-binding MarR family transcriptional regulator
MNEHVTLGRLIACLYRQAQIHLEKKLAPLGLGSGTYAYMLMLAHHDTMSQNEITKHLVIDKATTTRAIQKLLKLGYVNKVQDPDDQRAFRISLTEKGKEQIPPLRQVLQEWTDILSRNFLENDKKTAVHLLQRMVENALENRNNNHKDKKN